MTSQLREIFNTFDKDGDGLISIDDFNNLMEALDKNFSSSDLKILLREIQPEGKEMIDFTDFVTIEAKLNREYNTDEDIKQAFLLFDKDQDGFLNALELSCVMKSIGDNMSLEDINEMIIIGDHDGDGKMGIDDFSKMMKRDS